MWKKFFKTQKNCQKPSQFQTLKCIVSYCSSIICPKEVFRRRRLILSTETTIKGFVRSSLTIQQGTKDNPRCTMWKEFISNNRPFTWKSFGNLNRKRKPNLQIFSSVLCSVESFWKRSSGWTISRLTVDCFIPRSQIEKKNGGCPTKRIHTRFNPFLVLYCNET